MLVPSGLQALLTVRQQTQSHKGMFVNWSCAFDEGLYAWNNDLKLSWRNSGYKSHHRFPDRCPPHQLLYHLHWLFPLGFPFPTFTASLQHTHAQQQIATMLNHNTGIWIWKTASSDSIRFDCMWTKNLASSYLRARIPVAFPSLTKL